LYKSKEAEKSRNINKCLIESRRVICRIMTRGSCESQDEEKQCLSEEVVMSIGARRSEERMMDGWMDGWAGCFGGGGSE